MTCLHFYTACLQGNVNYRALSNTHKPTHVDPEVFSRCKSWHENIQKDLRGHSDYMIVVFLYDILSVRIYDFSYSSYGLRGRWFYIPPSAY